MKSFFFLYLIFGTLLYSKVLVSPIEAMQENYGAEAFISKKNIILSKVQYENIKKNAQTKLDTKIYRIYKATKDEKVLGYGVLINRKVRSKNAVALYFISKNTLLGIEIIAFNEPLQYLPTKRWNKQFVNIPTDKMLQLNRDIPSISGATLSAKSIINGSRLAFSVYNELLKGE